MRLQTAGIVAAVAAIVLFVVFTAGPPDPLPNPPGTFSFAVLGDAPYYPWEEVQFGLVVKALNRNDVDFVIHVGDIFWHPCSDAMYEKTLERFDSVRPPLIYTPGDNEWADCWEAGSGGYKPLERLNRIRQILFSDPPKNARQAEYIENQRWTNKGVMFATVHLVGSWNAMRPFPGRTALDDDASRKRTAAAIAWMRETFAQARESSAVVIAFHANPAFEEPPAKREAFEPFLAALDEESAKFGKPVLVVHGDGHDYIIDRPMKHVLRMQVPGSPLVGWVRVFVKPNAPQPFSFRDSVVPRWKYW